MEKRRKKIHVLPLNRRSFEVLEWVVEHKEITGSSIAEGTGLADKEDGSQGIVYNALHRLERLRLVERGKRQGRYWPYYATLKGKKVAIAWRHLLRALEL